jgi:hypothetical protein
MDNDNNFWTFISKRLKAEAALADWRLMLGDKLDFDKLQQQYLTPTGKMANLVMCPKQCNPSCGFRKVCEWEEKYEAACREWPLKSYKIEKADALFFTVKPSGLLPEITKIFKITPHIEEFNNEEDTWKLGVVPIPGGKSATVYLTLKVWNHEIMDLIYRLNCEERRPYILLVTARKIIHGTSQKVLNDMCSAFVPLNEVLDFNAQTEFELIRECNLIQLVTPSAPEPESELENIFRKCGDAWEVRFAGGEKFILTGVETGAKYLHFMLAKPNVATPVVEIMRGFAVEKDIQFIESIDDGNLSDGYDITDFPLAKADNIADATALRQYRQEIILLNRNIADAIENGDNVTAEQLQHDLDRITCAINEAVSPAGQKKKFVDQKKNLIDACRNAVNFTIGKISIYDSALERHFRTTIKCGQTPGYFPDGSISWEL